MRDFLKPTRYKLKFFVVFGGYFVLAPLLLLFVLPMTDFLDHLSGLEFLLLIPAMLVMFFLMPAAIVFGALVNIFLDPRNVTAQDFIVLGICFLTATYLIGCLLEMKRNKTSTIKKGETK